MGKISDKIIFGLAVILITFAWSFYLFDNLKLACLVTAFVFAAVNMLYLFLKSRKKNLSIINAQEMCLAFALMGSEKTAEHLYNTLPEAMRENLDGQTFLYIKDQQKTLVYVNYKFGATNEEDIAKAYRKSMDKKTDEIYILSLRTDRKVMVFAARLPVRYRFIDKRVVKKYLASRNALPQMPLSKERKRAPFHIKDALLNALDSRRIKYYVFVGLTLFLTSFFTPLKLYYLIISSIPLLLAAASAVYSMINNR